MQMKLKEPAGRGRRMDSKRMDRRSGHRLDRQSLHRRLIERCRQGLHIQAVSSSRIDRASPEGRH